MAESLEFRRNGRPSSVEVQRARPVLDAPLLRSTFAALAALLAATAAHAQSCHLPEARNLLEPGFRLALAQETASFRSPRYDGHYESLVLRGSVTHAWFSASVALPAYRIVRNGLAGRGAGDLFVDAQARAIRSERGAAQAGLVASATLPTGDERKDLGMGHFMLMPGVWATASAASFFASAQVAYGRALTSSSGHHHGAARPLVAPMSSSEVDAALSASAPIYGGWPSLRWLAGADAALPVFDGAGSARADARAGFAVGRRVQTTLQLYVPLVGEVASKKLVLELSVRFP